jgi:hypothetical protein
MIITKTSTLSEISVNNNFVQLYDRSQLKYIASTIDKVDEFLSSINISGGSKLKKDMINAYQYPCLTVSSVVSMFDYLSPSDPDDWNREFVITFTVLNYCTVVIGTLDPSCIQIIKHINQELFGN